MSKFSIILCAVFLVSVVTAKDRGVIDECVDSLEQASELIWAIYADLPEPKNSEKREELYKLSENGAVSLDKIIDGVSNAETMEVAPVSLPSDIGSVTFQCSKEAGDSAAQIVVETMRAMKNYD